MRSVDGAENLRFCWNPALGWLQVHCAELYPGDDVVDYIGVDVYDDSWAPNTYPLEDTAGTEFWKNAGKLLYSAEEMATRRDAAWQHLATQGGEANPGLNWFIKFAREHHKPLCFPEWGVSRRPDGHGGLDNPQFIARMWEVIMNPVNNVAWHCYFDVQAGDGAHQVSPGLTGAEKVFFPQSAVAFRELFGPAGIEKAQAQYGAVAAAQNTTGGAGAEP
jgi:hypothetical protein